MVIVPDKNLTYAWIRDPLERYLEISQGLINRNFLIRTDLSYLLSPNFLGIDEFGLVAVSSLTELRQFGTILPIGYVKRVLVWQNEPNSEIIHPNFRGYDIFDNHCGVSGLSNCGYDDEEIIELRPTYSDKINEYGLFKTLEFANHFNREVASNRAFEHQPFSVIGIYYFDTTDLEKLFKNPCLSIPKSAS